MDTDIARHQMVAQQIRAWDVHDPEVLEVFAMVSRERFVPAAYRELAFADTQIPLGRGQKMMTPTIEGRLLQALGLTEQDRVLEIGTGSGFLTACLSKLAHSVCSIDIFDEFVSSAGAKLRQENIGNVELACLDACQQLPDGEFDAIAVTGSLPRFDDRYLARLRPGGRLFVVVGDSPVQEARIVTRGDGPDWASKALFETSLTPLVHSAPPPEFIF